MRSSHEATDESIRGIVEMVEPRDEPPLLLVFATPEVLTSPAFDRCLRAMKKVSDGIKERTGVAVPFMILEAGATLELIQDPRNKP